MSKLIIFRIDRIDDTSNSNQGFTTSCQAIENGQTLVQVTVCFPPVPEELFASQQKLLKTYRSLPSVRINFSDDNVTNEPSTPEECQTQLDNFKHCFISWLGQNDFGKLREFLLSETQTNESFRVVFQTEHTELLRFPWQCWIENLKLRRRNAKVVLCPSLNSINDQVGSFRRPIRVLAVLGSRTGIDIGTDRNLIDQLKHKGAEVEWLDQPERTELELDTQSQRKLLSKQLWEQRWDIFFFAGHSFSSDQALNGRIKLNDGETLALNEIKSHLIRAARQGLKVAIFNSCDGLGMAHNLATAGIPYTIVMREPVPDCVAQEFLCNFFTSFLNGTPIDLAVKEASQCLESLENEYPGASLLPILCHDPNAPELIWPRENIWQYISRRRRQFGLLLMAFIAFITVVLFTPLVQNKIGSFFHPNYGSSASYPNSSLGEKILINSSAWKSEGDASSDNCVNNYPKKQAGADVFKTDIVRAIDNLSSFHEKCNRDPEAQIYLNNALALKKINVGISEKPNLELEALKSKNLLRIAAVVPTGGNNDTKGIAQEILRGVAQAQVQINNEENGINKRLLQVQIVNDTEIVNDMPNDLTSKVATDLSNDPAIIGVIGHYTSEGTINAGQEYEKGKLILIAPTSTAMRTSAFSSYVIRTAPTDKKAAEDLAKYIPRSKYSQVAIIYEGKGKGKGDHEGSIYGESIKGEVENKLKSQKVIPIDPDECNLSGNFDQEVCVNKICDKDTKALLLLPATQISSSNNPIVNAINEIYSKCKRPLFGGDAVYGEVTLSTVGRKVEGMRVAIPWHLKTGPAGRVDDFLSKSERLWKVKRDAINWRTALAYDATKALAEGLRKMGDHPNREKLRNVLLDDAFVADGFLGSKTVKFDEKGERKDTEGLGTIVEVKCDSKKCYFDKPESQPGASS